MTQSSSCTSGSSAKAPALREAVGFLLLLWVWLLAPLLVLVLLVILRFSSSYG